MPKTKFSRDIMGGKLMAKSLKVCCFSSPSSCALKRSVAPFPPNLVTLTTIVLLTGLCWLRPYWGGYSGWRARAHGPHVDASEWKHRYLMFLIKKCVRRTKWSFKVSFDNPHHLISKWRSSSGGDTGSNESGHRWTKTAAMLAQKGRHIQQSDRTHARNTLCVGNGRN
jgi:hypothetical protein